AILDRCPNGIDSEGWSQDITAQSNVRGRHAQLAPALCAMLYPSADLPVTAEQECRPGRIAGLQILSHERGGIDLLRGSRGRSHFHSRHIEAEAPTESDQGLHIPSALVAEAKVFTGYHMLQRQSFGQHVACECLGGKSGELFIEAQDPEHVEPKRLEKLRLYPKGGQPKGWQVRRKKSTRMWLEGDHSPGGTCLFCELLGLFQE